MATCFIGARNSASDMEVRVFLYCVVLHRRTKVKASGNIYRLCDKKVSRTTYFKLYKILVKSVV